MARNSTPKHEFLTINIPIANQIRTKSDTKIDINVLFLFS